MIALIIVSGVAAVVGVVAWFRHVINGYNDVERGL